MKLERAALILLMMAVGTSANGTNETPNSNTPSPTTISAQATDDKYVVELTEESFNQSVANGSHFLMFYDPT